MDGFSLLWIYNIKNGQMSHKDDYTSTLDLSARTEIKAGGKTITGFDLSWKRSSFFRHAWSSCSCREVRGHHHPSTSCQHVLTSCLGPSLWQTDTLRPWPEDASPGTLRGSMGRCLPYLFAGSCLCFVLFSLFCFAGLTGEWWPGQKGQAVPWCCLASSAPLVLWRAGAQPSMVPVVESSPYSLLAGLGLLISSVVSFPCKEQLVCKQYRNGNSNPHQNK